VLGCSQAETEREKIGSRVSFDGIRFDNLENSPLKAKNFREKSYSKASTLELITCIVEDSDNMALRFLLETRPLFRLKEKPPLLLTEFLMGLRERLIPQKTCDIETSRLADCAYDLTISKFSSLPDTSKDREKQGNVRRKTVDCRNYYRAFLTLIQRRKEEVSIKTQAEEESLAGFLLQKLVWKHFQLSKKECERNNPLTIRYTMEAGNRKIYLWYPSNVTVKEFKSWLKETTKNLDLNERNAQERIQNLIKEELVSSYPIPLDESRADHVKDTADASSVLEMEEGRTFVRNLAEAVAEEKSETIDTLRPAIGRLGKKGVKNLVLQIFSDISREDYQITRLAQQYGISKASLSRFAGSTWFEKTETDEDAVIPDLWKNTAKVLAGSPDFMETVAATGFAGNLAWVLDRVEGTKGGSDG